MSLEEKIKSWCEKNDFYYNVGGEDTTLCRIYYLIPKIRGMKYLFYELVVEEPMFLNKEVSVSILINPLNVIYKIEDIDKYAKILKSIQIKAKGLREFLKI